jgi:ubiquinone/menaquinone biosynthesis C-methylase UbiE
VKISFHLPLGVNSGTFTDLFWPEEKKALETERWTQAAAAGYSAGVIDSRYLGEIYDKFVQTLVPILKHLPNSFETKVLDVASASGEPAVSLAKALPNISILSTDIAKTFMPFAELHAKQIGVNNVSFDVADGEKLHYANNAFDAVCCSMGLMSMPSEDKALRECLRVLKPGGVFAGAVWGADVPMMTSVMGVAAEFNPSLKETGVTYDALRFGDARGLEQEIKAAGFVDVEHQVLDVTCRFASRNWRNEILSAGPTQVAQERTLRLCL